MDVTKLIGENVRKARLKRGLTQQQLADAAASSPQQVSNIEAGRANPTIVTVQALAVALGVTPAALLTP